MCCIGCRNPSDVQPDARSSLDGAASDAVADASAAPPLVDGGQLAWSKRAGGNGFDTAAGLGVLADGSWLATGIYSSNAAVFGAGEANETTLPPSPYGEYDVFLARYQSTGALAWARRVAGGPTFEDDIARGLHVLSDGSSIIAGSYEGTTTFDGDIQDITLTTANNGNFLARFDAVGSVVWAYDAIGGELAGLANGTTTAINGPSIARYTAAGSNEWTRTITSTGYAMLSAVTMLTDGSSLIAGELHESVTFVGPGGLTLTATNPPGTNDAFIAKYAADGSLVWARRAIGSAFIATPAGIAALDDGSFVMTGYFGTHAESSQPIGSALFAPGLASQTSVPYQALNMFVARFSSTGDLLWVRTATSPGHEFAYDVAVAADQTIVIGGYFGIYNGNSMTLGQAPHQLTLTRQAEADAWLASYTADGDLRWAKRAGDSGRTNATQIALFADGSALVSGDLEATTTFGMGESNATTLTAQGNADPFFARFAP